MKDEEKNKKIEEVKSSLESKVKEEVESLLGSQMEEVAGGTADSEEPKECSCGVAFAKA